MVYYSNRHDSRWLLLALTKSTRRSVSNKILSDRVRRSNVWIYLPPGPVENHANTLLLTDSATHSDFDSPQMTEINKHRHSLRMIIISISVNCKLDCAPPRTWLTPAAAVKKVQRIIRMVRFSFQIAHRLPFLLIYLATCSSFCQCYPLPSNQSFTIASAASSRVESSQLWHSTPNKRLK